MEKKRNQGGEEEMGDKDIMKTLDFDNSGHSKFDVNSISSDYEMDILVLYKEGSDSYKEIIQDYAQSLYVNTHVKAVSHTEISLEDLKRYDLIYPDVSLVDANSIEEIVDNLTDYVRKGGNLFLEEDLYKIFPKEVLGMSKIVNVNLKNQTFDFPIVPQKYQDLQKLWKTYSIKETPNFFYDVIGFVYRKFKRRDVSDAWNIFFEKYKSSASPEFDLTKVDIKTHALPDTAISLVNSNGFTLLSINGYGNGTVLWTINHIPKRGTYFGKPFMTRLDLGYPDPKAKNFHFGYATINYLMRNAYLDFIAKEKYGFSIQKVFGAYGRPSLSWQNHLDNIAAWKNNEMIRWINILREEHQIPTFSLIRGTHLWAKPYGTVILNLNAGNNSEPTFTQIGSETPYLLSGTRLQKADGSYIEAEKVTTPFVIDWNEDGKKDLIVGTGDGKIYYYQNIGTNEKPVFLNKEILKEGEKDLNVGSNASPFVVDWNEDGKKDLIVGAGDGKIYYYENVGTNEKTVFLNKEILKEGEKELNVGSNASPFVVDWNEDGKKDLIVGNGEGNIYYCQNIGTNEKTVFLNKEILKEGEKDLNVGSNASPFVVDWNEDGKKDLIVGNGEGNVYYYQNAGTNEKSVFLNKKLVRKSETDFMQAVIVVQSASPFVVDWNEDGKKDLIIGAAEQHETYAINSPYLRKDIERNINSTLKHSICITPHCYVGYNYTPEQELCELEKHKKAFEDLGIPWKKTLGTNHHAWSVHSIPVWQTLYTEKDFELVYNFGWHSMAADFPEFYCTTHPYMPYGMPFLLMKSDIEAYPFIIWTPNILKYTTFDGKSSLFVFPSSFDLPITYFFHPDEEAFKYKKRDILYSYLRSIIKFKTIPIRLDIHSGKAYKVINSFNKLRDEHEYNMMSEEQAAKAMLNMYYTKVYVKINGNKLTLFPDTSDVPETAEEYKNTLGIKIELQPDFISDGITTDSSIFYKPSSRKIYLGLYKETQVTLNESPANEFHLVRCNVPFELNGSLESYEITVKSAGMRQFKIFSPYPLKVKNKDVIFVKKGKYYMVTDYGDLNKTISLYTGK